MELQDGCVTLAPYFKLSDGQLEAFKALSQQFVEKTRTEPKCLFYGYAFAGDVAHCREGYADAEGLLTHLANVDGLLQQALKISTITRLEVHGPAEELARLREPLGALAPQFFTLEHGFRL